MSKDLQMLSNKCRFVAELGEVLAASQVGSVEGMEYVVFQHKNGEWTQEFLKVNYDGGVYTIRNCNGNSRTAIYKEAAKLLDGGYYEEVEYYKVFVDSDDWEQLDLLKEEQ